MSAVCVCVRVCVPVTICGSVRKNPGCVCVFCVILYCREHVCELESVANCR